MSALGTGGLASFAMGSVLVYLAVPRIHDRVTSWLSPFDHPRDLGYQMVQSLYALVDGGIVDNVPIDVVRAVDVQNGRIVAVIWRVFEVSACAVPITHTIPIPRRILLIMKHPVFVSVFLTSYASKKSEIVPDIPAFFEPTSRSKIP